MDDIGWLRAIGALVLGPVSCWFLASVEKTWSHIGFFAVGMLVTLMWAAMTVRTLRQPRSIQRLVIDNEGIRIQTGDDEQFHGWDELGEVAIDEDRLVVRVERDEGEPWMLDANWSDASVYDVAEAIRAAQPIRTDQPAPATPARLG